jgi:hypothetical protein
MAHATFCCTRASKTHILSSKGSPIFIIKRGLENLYREPLVSISFTNAIPNYMYTSPQHACTNSHDLHAFSFRSNFSNHPNKKSYLVLSIFVTIISVAPMALKSSITLAMFFLSTIACTATQSSSSKLLTVGARLPGVILEALARFLRSTL